LASTSSHLPDTYTGLSDEPNEQHFFKAYQHAPT
jgi:hypothetical protein